MLRLGIENSSTRCPRPLYCSCVVSVRTMTSSVDQQEGSLEHQPRTHSIFPPRFCFNMSDSGYNLIPGYEKRRSYPFFRRHLYFSLLPFPYKSFHSSARGATTVALTFPLCHRLKLEHNHQKALWIPCISVAKRYLTTTNVNSGETLSSTQDTEVQNAAEDDCIEDESTEEELLDDGVERASALLREVYGPHAKLVVQRQKVRRRPQSVTSDDSVGSPQSPSFRAASTFKLLGFPVELASVTGPDLQVVVEHCLDLSLRSDIPFIDPRKRPPRQRGGRGRGRVDWQGNQGGMKKDAPGFLTPHEIELKAIIDELRELCIHFSRRLKFAVKDSLSTSGSLASSPAPSREMLEAVEHERSRKKWTQEGCAGSKDPLFDSEVCGKRMNESNSSDQEKPLFRCRVYQKDEWFVVARSTFVLESTGTSPHRALLQSMVQLREMFKQQLEEPEQLLAGVEECRKLLEPIGKSVEADVFSEKGESGGSQNNGRAKEVSVPLAAIEALPSTYGSTAAEYCNEGEETSSCSLPSDENEVEDSSPLPLIGLTTFSAVITVQDRYGNIGSTKLRRQRSRFLAYHNAAQQVLRAEQNFLPTAHLLSDGATNTPLLTRVRWQVCLLSQYIAQAIGTSNAEDVVSVVVKGVNDNMPTEGGEPAGTKQKAARPLLYTATVTSEGGNNVLSVASGSGRYRLTLDAYVLALRYLFEHYYDSCNYILCQQLCANTSLSIFPSRALLDEAVKRHDEFSVLTHHKGKWNCFAVLGTLTSSLIGSYFQTTYQSSTDGKEWWATLTVNTGESSEEILIQRSAKMKGEAWKRACVEALRENFPKQHAEVVRVHPDVDLSHDTLAKSSKYRSLPREKRVEHIPNLFAMVCAFAEEDLGWYQPRIRFRNTSMELGFPQWVAELEATVEDDQERRIVAVSPPYLHSRTAKRILIWRVAQQYFPKELEFYKALKRGDGADPTMENATEKLNKYYKPNSGISFVDQLFSVMERNHESMLPFSWTLTGSVKRSSKDGNNEMVAGEATYLGDGETIDRLLQPLNIQYEGSILGNHGDLLIADYKGKMLVVMDSSSSLPGSSRREESAVEVFLTALKTASHHLCKSESETIWTEFETHVPPSVPSSRELCLHLFYALWGNQQYNMVLSSLQKNGVVGSPEQQQSQQVDPIVDIHAVKVGDQWVGTVFLPALNSLPIARAYGSTKKKCVRDALILGTRRCFFNILNYWAKNVPSVAELAKEILTEPVISELNESLVKDVHRQLYQEKKKPHPFQLLLHYLHQQFVGSKQIRVERSRASGNEHHCRLYLQPKTRTVQKGATQLVGFGAARSPEEALHLAACLALENLYDEKYSDTK